MKYDLQWLETLNISGLNGQGVTQEGFYRTDEHLEFWKILDDGTPFMICRGPIAALIVDELVGLRVEKMLEIAQTWKPTFAEYKANGGEG